MTPSTEAELSAAIDAASAPLEITGGGSRAGIGRPVNAAETLSTEKLTGITLYDPGALTIVAKAGTPLREIEEALAAEGQRLPFEPMDHRALLGTSGEPTIGGVVAGNISGPRRIQAGACRDSLIGVRFVDGTGTVIKNGGRVMKNVTGYDLVKLMAGSWGTLGVLSEVSFKVLPTSETTTVLFYEGLSDKTAVQAMSAALSSPYEVTGAAHLPEGTDGSPLTVLRLEGFEKSVAYRTQELADELARFGAPRVETDPAKTSAIWGYIRDVEGFANRPGDVWKFSVKPTDGPTLGASLRAAGATALQYDWGGGLIWALAPEGTDLRHAMTVQGHATLIRASAATRAAVPPFQPEAAPIAALSKGLREKFDPKGILNPGRMV
ncbi:MAG: FAD-binding protein [Pseudomonadota bacterium]